MSNTDQDINEEDFECYISRVVIENFKTFHGRFDIDLEQGVNILVGDNETGKSSILEAIHLVLTGYFQGKNVVYDISENIFNKQTKESYIDSVNDNRIPSEDAPSITIELYLDGFTDDNIKALFEGDGNKDTIRACGLKLQIGLNESYGELYNELVKEDIHSLPVEYYECKWSTFARDERLRTSILPIKSALVDAISSRNQNGMDTYISRIFKDVLEESQQVQVSRSHRELKDKFNESIDDINSTIKNKLDITDKKVSLSVDLSSRNAWRSSLVVDIDDVPFHLVGKGEQAMIKTQRALSHKKNNEANILLLEEPENHLSHTNLNHFVESISKKHRNKQIIITTHSSFVANKLGVERLMLLSKSNNTHKKARLNELQSTTKAFFYKLPGFDTLRLILCKRVILVEGPSDELIVQRAYYDHYEKLPIQDNIEVISVGTSFLRFLELGALLDVDISVVIDNDGAPQEVKDKFSDYESNENISIHYDEEVDSPGSMENFNYNTLEPKLLKANNLSKLNEVFGKEHSTEDRLLWYMQKNKTECALAVFNANTRINYPDYIKSTIIK